MRPRHLKLLQQGANERHRLLPLHGERPLRAPLSLNHDNLIVPLTPLQLSSPIGTPPSTDVASSVGRHRVESPSTSPRRAASTGGSRCRLLARRPDSAPLVLIAPTEPPPGHRRTAGELATVRATAAVTARLCPRWHAHESGLLAFGSPSRPGRFNRLLAQRSCKPRAGSQPTSQIFFIF
jgi:hypothetical protein